MKTTSHKRNYAIIIGGDLLDKREDSLRILAFS